MQVVHRELSRPYTDRTNVQIRAAKRNNNLQVYLFKWVHSIIQLRIVKVSFVFLGGLLVQTRTSLMRGDQLLIAYIYTRL